MRELCWNSVNDLRVELAHTLPQPAHHLRQRQYHLHRRISVGCHLFEPFHGSLRFNLVWFLHSDSPFLAKENVLSAYQDWERRVATFYDLAGIPPDGERKVGFDAATGRLHHRYSWHAAA
jgi:hypothetical protein